MSEDVVAVGALLIGITIFGWSLVHALSGIVVQIPADDLCRTAAECAAAVLAQ
jgi:hypothetical protein